MVVLVPGLRLHSREGEGESARAVPQPQWFFAYSFSPAIPTTSDYLPSLHLSLPIGMSTEMEKGREIGCWSSNVDHTASDADGCTGGGFKLFGVCLTPTSPPSACSYSASMRKSFSMDKLSNYGPSTEYSFPSTMSPLEQPDLGRDLADGSGYASDDLVHTNSNTRERRKGVPWTEEEHRTFLLGLQKLGKGDWRGIARSFVKSRTPTQVASHAQKYFLRRNNLSKRRRRSSLFDITPDTVSTFLRESVLEEPECEDVDACQELIIGQNISCRNGVDGGILSGQVYHTDNEFVAQRKSDVGSRSAMQPMLIDAPEASEEGQEANASSRGVADKVTAEPIPAFVSLKCDSMCGSSLFPPSCTPMRFYPLSNMPVPFAGKPFSSSHESNIVRPTPVFPLPGKIDAELKLPDISPGMEPTSLSHKLAGEGSRHSAFRTMPSNGQNSQGNARNAISFP